MRRKFFFYGISWRHLNANLAYSITWGDRLWECTTHSALESCRGRNSTVYLACSISFGGQLMNKTVFHPQPTSLLAIRRPHTLERLGFAWAGNPYREPGSGKDDSRRLLPVYCHVSHNAYYTKNATLAYITPITFGHSRKRHQNVAFTSNRFPWIAPEPTRQEVLTP